MRDFNNWSNYFRQGMMSEFNTDVSGLFWLKLKSIVRKDFLSDFAEAVGLDITDKNLNVAFEFLFSTLSSNASQASLTLDAFIRDRSRQQIDSINIESLVSELYKMRTFEWGGDYKNSLDKYLISRFIKTDDPSYENLLDKFDTEINPSVRGYVLNSWYNYWSSILIENIFKSHPSVLPTIGKIKSVDFFIHDIPFDLKVTYLPSEYIAKKRRENGFPVELTFLKRKARLLNIFFDENASPDTIEHEIIEKMKDRNTSACRDVLNEIHEQNLSILETARSFPNELSKWLYENQGEMRFGSENRIYLILVDSDNFKNSWALKRNVDLLRPVINQYLNNFSQEALTQNQIEFTYRTETFSAIANTIFTVS